MDTAHLQATIDAAWSELFKGIYLKRTLVAWVLWCSTYLTGFGILSWMPTRYRTVFHLDLATAPRYGAMTTGAGLAGVLAVALLAASMSALVFLYTAELYPTRLRARGTSLASAWQKLGWALGQLAIGFIVADYGIGLVFLSFGLVCMVAALTSGVFAIEARGRVLEEVSP